MLFKKNPEMPKLSYELVFQDRLNEFQVVKGALVNFLFISVMLS